ncbi:MAG: hypothetical protein WKF75_03200, partial [Singulisphaera sp.]
MEPGDHLAAGGVEAGRINPDAVLGGVVAGQGRLVDDRPLNVDGHVEPDRAGTAAPGQVDRPFEVVADRSRVGDQHGVFGDRFDQPDDVDFLVAELPEGQAGAPDEGFPLHLAGDHDHPQRVGPGAD